MDKISLEHVDIVTTHRCNSECDYCIDSFRNTSKDIVKMCDVDKFLNSLRDYTDESLTVLLLGGEPTILPTDKLKALTDIIHNYGFRASISTNGKAYKKILKINSFFDSIQVTINDFSEIDLFYSIKDQVNIKLPGDSGLHWNKLSDFMDETSDFYRQSVPMYFNPSTFEELCTDKDIWDFLDSLKWGRKGSYKYAFYDKVRFKKCIFGETNIIDEPTIPKLYPNGNYNCNWLNEDMNNYLNLNIFQH